MQVCAQYLLLSMAEKMTDPKYRSDVRFHWASLLSSFFLFVFMFLSIRSMPVDAKWCAIAQASFQRMCAKRKKECREIIAAARKLARASSTASESPDPKHLVRGPIPKGRRGKRSKRQIVARSRCPLREDEAESAAGSEVFPCLFCAHSHS
jgi:hypothetical protein